MRKVINNLLEYSKLNPKQFAERIGLSRPQAIYDILSGKTRSISEGMKNKIISAFPEIDIRWLLTGEGEMLRTTPQAVSQQGDSSTIVTGNGNVGNGNGNRVDSSSEALNKALDALASSQRMHETTQAQLGRFQEQTAKFQEQIDHLIALLERPRK